jgi:hypothetical protein
MDDGHLRLARMASKNNSLGQQSVFLLLILPGVWQVKRLPPDHIAISG